jgi:hypothetical protein
MRTGFVSLLFLLFLPVPVGTSPLCLSLDAGESRAVTVPVTSESEIRLSFRHSLYDSTVEEIFTAHPGKLQIIRILYAEPRLAEFYGHEFARYQNGVWVVVPERRSFDALDLRVSSDSLMSLSFDSKVISLGEVVEAGSAVRVTVVPCSRASDGK